MQHFFFLEKKQNSKVRAGMKCVTFYGVLHGQHNSELSLGNFLQGLSGGPDSIRRCQSASLTQAVHHAVVLQQIYQFVLVISI